MEPPQERATVESASPPEIIPTPLIESASPPVEQPAEPDKNLTPPAESVSPPEKIPTPTAEPENIPTPSAENASPPENIPTPPAERLVESLPERPDTPLEIVDPPLLMIGAHVEVTSYLPTPPLITRCDKSTQTDSPSLELGKRLLERPQLLTNTRLAIQPKTPVQQTTPPTIILFIPNHHSVLKLGTHQLIVKPNPVNNVNK
ncbi:hypothetical protein TNCT_699911 [Trichonephila clavata]|uniref:Uncharacterized protein n=1 Tax=Trichonephila clavata TaxID=2740835 RepID=A0A8X6G1X2_TRICU|nr:hypothetical protein TNCT_699911 [Trichonephila clavata]